MSYDAIGSGEGTKQFLAGAVDFGASDAALSDEEMAAVTPGAQLVPVMAGSIVLAYNLDELSGPLKLTRAVYADIFLGKTTSWDDPCIQLRPSAAAGGLPRGARRGPPPLTCEEQVIGRSVRVSYPRPSIAVASLIGRIHHGHSVSSISFPKTSFLGLACF